MSDLSGNALLERVYEAVTDATRKVIRSILPHCSEEVTLDGKTIKEIMQDLLVKLEIPAIFVRDLDFSKPLPSVRYILAPPEIAITLTGNVGEEISPMLKNHGYIGACCVYSEVLLPPNRLWVIEDVDGEPQVVKAVYLTNFLI